MTKGSQSSTSTSATLPASSSLPAPASVHPPSRRPTSSHSSVSGHSRFTRVDAVYVWTQGGYQVSRDPDDYPIFIAVREQDIDAWETFFAPFGLPTAFERQPSDEIDGRLQIVLEPRPSLDIEHVEGYPVIPRETRRSSICVRTTPISVGAGDARPDVRGPRPRRRVSGDRTGTDIASITEVTRSSNCSRSSRKRGTSTSLWGGYAVSASNARFSTDLDIVVAPDSKADFVEFIEHRGFEETDSHAKESLLVSLESGSSSASLSSLSPAGVLSSF